MRSNQRRKEKDDFKKVLYVSGIIVMIALIAFIAVFISYYNNLKKNTSNLEALNIARNSANRVEEDISEEASLSVGKTIEESQNMLDENVVNITPDTNTANNETINSNTNSSTNKKENNVASENIVKETLAQEEVVHDPEFVMPVTGEISKEYAKDNLIYSETLKEWVTHNGIDIKAEKASVVKASEEGTVTSIKNDPRYGMTITIEHSNGFQTRYSNLLTTEFVNVGEKVAKEQTIGTVGNTAAFEVADDFHLHFEILKDNENLDPTLYIK